MAEENQITNKEGKRIVRAVYASDNPFHPIWTQAGNIQKDVLYDRVKDLTREEVENFARESTPERYHFLRLEGLD